MIANSGRFTNTLPHILGESPFHRFLMLSDTLYKTSGSTWKIALKRLFGLLQPILVNELALAESEVNEMLQKDFARAGFKGTLDFSTPVIAAEKKVGKGTANKRQKIHQSS